MLGQQRCFLMIAGGSKHTQYGFAHTDFPPIGRRSHGASATASAEVDDFSLVFTRLGIGNKGPITSNDTKLP